MAGPSSIDDTAAHLGLGVWMQPGSSAPDWADLEARIVAIMDDRTANIPWLPPGWKIGVEALRKQFPGWRIMVAPPISTNGTVLPTAPAWLDTPEKVKAWNGVASAIKEGINLYATGRINDGKAYLDELYADAEFWTNVHLAAVFIAEAPEKVVSAAGNFASGMLGTFLTSFFPILVVGGIVVVVWYNKEAIGKALGGRVVKAIG